MAERGPTTGAENPALGAGLQRAAVPCALGLTLVLALWLRLTGIGFGLPYLHHPDEPNKLTAAARMVAKGDLNPRYFKKPTIVIYLNALVALGYVTAAKATGRLERRSDFHGPSMLLIGTGRTDFPEVVWLGRTLSALLGVLTVFLTYVIGRRYLGQVQAPLLAALGVALSPSEVRQSHFIETNILVGLGILGVAWAALRVLERGERRDYLLAGFLVGIATSCKYTGAASVALLIAAHLLRVELWSMPRALWPRALGSWPLASGLSMVPLGFLVGTPYALPELRFLISSVAGEASHYSTGHPGQEGGAVLWYLQHALTREGPLVALGFAATVWAAMRKASSELLLSSFVVSYFLFISAFEVRNEQTFMPLVPFAHLLGAAFVLELARRGLALNAPKRWLALAALGLVVLAGVALPLHATHASNGELAARDGRQKAGLWIKRNIPAGTRVAIESYSPWVSPERYDVRKFRRLWQVSPDELVESEIQYVVFSSGVYGALFSDRARHQREVAAYEAHWRRFPLVRTLTGAGLEIRIHAVTNEPASSSMPRGGEHEEAVDAVQAVDLRP